MRNDEADGFHRIGLGKRARRRGAQDAGGNSERKQDQDRGSVHAGSNSGENKSHFTILANRRLERTCLRTPIGRGYDAVEYAPFAAQIMFGGLAPAVAQYRDACARHGKPHGRAVCSYFIHIAETRAEEESGTDFLMRYFKNSGMRPPSGTGTRTENLPPSMAYYTKIVGWLQNFKREDLHESSFLLGSPRQIIESLKRIEEAGIDEVALYFNHGLKPHKIVMEQMERFMKYVAPAFASSKLAAPL